MMYLPLMPRPIRLIFVQHFMELLQKNPPFPCIFAILEESITRTIQEDTSTLKKNIIALISSLVLCLLFATQVFAALPPNLGQVQDRGSFFTAEDKAILKKEAKGEHYNFYILTVASLNGQDPADYATEVYHAWKLKSTDLLLVITQKERRIELNFNNPALQKVIDNLPADYDEDGDTYESKIKEVVDKYFIPLAKEGDFREATRKLMRATYLLGENAVKKPAATLAPLNYVPPVKPAKPTASVKPTTQPTVKPTAKPTVTPTVQPTVNPTVAATPKPDAAALHTPLIDSEAGQKRMGKVALLFVQIVPAFVAVLFPLTLMIMARRRKLALIRIRTQLTNQMGTLGRGLETLRPLIELSQGKTNKTAKEYEDRLTERLLGTQEILRQMEEKSLPFFRIKAANQIVSIFRNTADDNEAAVAAIQTLVDQLLETDRRIAPFIEHLKTASANAKVLLSHLSQKTGSTYEQYADQIAKTDSYIRQADDRDEFDPLTAMDIAEQVELAAQAITYELGELLGYVEKSEAYPANAAACRDVIAGIVRDNSLYAIAIDPYAPVEQSQGRWEHLQASLKAGNLDEVRSIWEDIEQLLKGAVAQVDQLAKQRRANQEKLAVLEQYIGRLVQEQAGLLKECERLSLQYASSIWEGQRQNFQAAEGQLAAQQARQAEARQLTSDEQQKFEEASRMMAQIHKVLEKIAGVFAQFRQSIKKWDDTLAEIFAGFQTTVEAYSDARSFAITQKLVLSIRPEFQQTIRQVEECHQQFIRMKERKPYLLKELEQAGLHLEEAVSVYQDGIEQLNAIKQQVLQSLNQMSDAFERVYRRASGFFYKNTIRRTYQTHVQTIQQIVESGHYEDANPHLLELEELIEEVNARNVEQERLAEIARREAAARREIEEAREDARREARRAAEREEARRSASRSSSWSSSSSSSSSRSSSSSSSSRSSSSSNSSGGSSWGSGGGNSSGGSNW